jgi:aspartate aminotransferase
MPEISRRARALPSSPIRKLVDHAVQAERDGVKVYYLNIGQPDIESPPEFWRAVRETPMRVLAYGHSAGTSEVREAYRESLRRHEVFIEYGDVLATQGGSEATLMAMLACFDPGDEVIVVEPFYANYAGFAVAAGVELRAITARIEEDFRLPEVAEIEGAITPRTSGILLCNPSNPTGVAYPEHVLRGVADLAIRHDLWLLVDEVYRDFYYGEHELVSVLQLAGADDRAVMIDSASKKLSVCGARVGFLVSRNPDVIAGALKYGQARLSGPTLDQLGVAAALRETGPEYYARVREEYVGRRDRLTAGLNAIPGVRVPPIHGAFYAVVQLPVDDAERFAEWLVREFRYENETVLVAPAAGFYLTPGLGKDEVRIAYVLDADQIERSVEILRAALAAYPGARQIVAARA